MKRRFFYILLTISQLIATPSFTFTLINGVPVPDDFPHFEANIMEDGIAPGRLFLANWFEPYYFMILENDGTPYFYQRSHGQAYDFKIQPNGLLSRKFASGFNGYVAMDSTFAVVDSFQCTGDVSTNGHEFIMTVDSPLFFDLR